LLQSAHYFVVNSEQVQLNREGLGSARKAENTSQQRRAAQVARFAFPERWGKSDSGYHRAQVREELCMQPSLKLGLLCDYALTSQDGKLSVLGIFSQINLGTLPGASPPFFVVVILTLDAGTYSVRFGIADPSGQQILPEPPPPFDVEVEMPGTDTNLVIQLNNLPLNRAGIYQIQLFVDGRIVHSIPLNVQGSAGDAFPPLRPN